MENLWLISVAALVVGGIIGFLFGRSGAGNSRQAELAEQLETTRNELESYKTDVANHFEKTAELVNNLTNSYQDVHQHLAGGAQNLCQPGTVDLALTPSLKPQLEESTEATTAPEESTEAPTTNETSVEPPRDYAPKEPDEEGTLSETFGLKEQSEETPEAEMPKDAAPPKTAVEQEKSA